MDAALSEPADGPGEGAVDLESDAGTAASSDYRLEEVLFYLVESGVHPDKVYGYHEGWDFDRIVSMFQYLKRRELEKRKESVLSMAIGASSVVSGKALKKFTDEIDRAIRSMASSSIAGQGQDQQNTHAMQTMQKLMEIVGGVQSR